MEWLLAILASLGANLTTPYVRQKLARLPWKRPYELVVERSRRQMMESGPFSPVWAKYEERINELARDMVEDARQWAEENRDVLTDQARYLKKADLPNVANTTTQMAIEFDFSAVRKDGPGFSISHAAKHRVDIPLPYVTFKPTDDKLGN